MIAKTRSIVITCSNHLNKIIAQSFIKHFRC